MGDRPLPEWDPTAESHYCVQAHLDVNLYRLVELGQYDEQQLERMSARFAARLLRAAAANSSAKAERQRRDTPG